MQIDSKTLWAEYERGLLYQRQMGFADNWPLFARMKQGRQWAEPTERTRNLPRPVFNMVESFIAVKTGELVRQPVALRYRGTGESDAMTERAATIWDAADQDELSHDFIEDAATYGTGVLHYYRSALTGDVKGEVIDPRRVFFTDPEVREVQAQRAVLIATDLPLSQVRAEAAKAEFSAEQLAAIRPVREAAGEAMATVITRYFRREGQVVFCRAVESGLLTPVTALGAGVSLYPIEVFCWRKRRDSIFGTGEAEGIIPNQRAINFVMAMLLLSVQQTAWPKMVVKEGALRHLPTNAPGEILTDYCPDGAGIRYLDPPACPTQAITVADKVYELTRQTAGVSEVMSGEPFSRSASAQAINALQMQAKVPIEALRLRYHRSLSNIGKIWAQLCGMGGGNPACAVVARGEEGSAHE